MMDVVAEMANFCDGVLQPLNETGDMKRALCSRGSR